MINRLVQQVAYHQLTTLPMMDKDDKEEAVIVPEPAQKKNKFKDPTMALLESMVAMSAVHRKQKNQLNPHEVAEKEIKYYQNIEKSEWSKFENTLTWWKKRKIMQNLPCLSQVAQALLGCLPSSGGLECDFGPTKGCHFPQVCISWIGLH
jgi:hypothetical protein